MRAKQQSVTVTCCHQWDGPEEMRAGLSWFLQFFSTRVLSVFCEKALWFCSELAFTSWGPLNRTGGTLRLLRGVQQLWYTKSSHSAPLRHAAPAGLLCQRRWSAADPDLHPSLPRPLPEVLTSSPSPKLLWKLLGCTEVSARRCSAPPRPQPHAELQGIVS